MSKELYVGHISENAGEEDVRKLFSVMGTVTSIHLIIDPDTGEFKRCGYVRMAAGIDLNEVAETLDGAYLIDREITVSIARPQKPGMSKSGGNKKPWMKPGAKPEPPFAAKPGSKPRPKSSSAAKPHDKPATATSSTRPSQGNAPKAATPQKPGRAARPAGKGSRPAGRTR